MAERKRAGQAAKSRKKADDGAPSASPLGVQQVGFSEPLLALKPGSKRVLRLAVLAVLGLWLLWKAPGWIGEWSVKKTLLSFTYKADPGQTGGWAYVDEDGSQLADGDIGEDDWEADLGSGKAYEWIGWRDVEPSVVLDLGDPAKAASAVQIHASHGMQGGVFLPKRVLVSTSADGLEFTPETVTDVARPTKGAHWIRVDLGGAPVRFIRLKLLDDEPGSWIFVSEIRVLKAPTNS